MNIGANDENLSEVRVLVIGAGGLGCEILKDLALSGFRQIEVIDMDTIDISNLNRQFLFRNADVGKSKAVVAAEYINRRLPGVNVVPHYKKIQDFDPAFYSQFNLVVSGLDSIEARRWLNSMLVSLVQYDAEGNVRQETVIPLIDGGTEGMLGQAMVILPGISACFECTLENFVPPTKFPLCTIANIPRLPEHCIEWASQIEWENVRKGTKLDMDNPEHANWIFTTALERAKKYNIQGVTYMLTLGVVKNIIPAIASTNAIIAAACVNEAFKLVTQSAPLLNNFFQYNGTFGTYSVPQVMERRPDCAVSGNVPKAVSIGGDRPLKDLIQLLLVDPRFQLKAPSLRYDGNSLYMRNVALEEATRPNLEKPLHSLMKSGQVIDVTDPSLTKATVRIICNLT